MNKDHFHLVGEELKSEPYLYRGAGLDGIYLLNGYQFEEHDGERHVSITNLEGLHRAIGRHLVLHRKGLLPKEIRFLRDAMDLSQAQLAEKLGNSPQSVARWEKGEYEVPGPEEKLLRAMFLAFVLTPSELKELQDALQKDLSELDKMDQMHRPQAQFAFSNEWTEDNADRALACG